jgi:translation initiation factor eIF-2B subunit delta
MAEPPAATPSAANPLKDPPKDIPKLSGAEQKKLKQAEKQAKRAAQKAESGAPPSNSAPTSAPALNPSSSKQAQKPKQGAKAAQDKPPKQGEKAGQSSKQPATQKTVQATAEVLADDWPTTVPVFSHLSIARRTQLDNTSKEVHPAILSLGAQISNYTIIGSTARTVALLQAFKAVITDYKAPADTAIARHLIPNCLGPQIEHIKACRPLSVGMGNAIRYLKDCIVKIDPSSSESEAKDLLLEQIDMFFRDRVVAAESVIVRETLALLKKAQPQTVLTFAHSSLVRRALLTARATGTFTGTVLVVDAAPLHEGATLSTILRTAGLTVELHPITSLAHIVSQTHLVLLGAQAVLANGAILTRSGAALVALHAHQRDVPVQVLCQAFKASERAVVDTWSGAVAEMAPMREILEGDGDEKEEERWIGRIKETNGKLRSLVPLVDVVPGKWVGGLISEWGPGVGGCGLMGVIEGGDFQ